MVLWRNLKHDLKRKRMPFELINNKVPKASLSNTKNAPSKSKKSNNVWWNGRPKLKVLPGKLQNIDKSGNLVLKVLLLEFPSLLEKHLHQLVVLGKFFSHNPRMVLPRMILKNGKFKLKSNFARRRIYNC